MQTPASDHSLLARIRVGDEDAATELYHRYARQLHALARRSQGEDLAVRADADDLVQSVFRTFFRRAKGGDFSVPRGDHLWKLLLTMALNKGRNLAAHHRASKRDVGRRANAAAAEEVAAEDDFPRVALSMVIEEVMQGLDESQRKIIELRIGGAEVTEIATLTGRARRSVERVLQGFREELAAILRADGLELE